LRLNLGIAVIWAFKRGTGRWRFDGDRRRFRFRLSLEGGRVRSVSISGLAGFRLRRTAAAQRILRDKIPYTLKPAQLIAPFERKPNGAAMWITFNGSANHLLEGGAVPLTVPHLLEQLVL